MSVLRHTFIPYVSAHAIIAFEIYSEEIIQRKIDFYNSRKLSNLLEMEMDHFQNKDFNISFKIISAATEKLKTRYLDKYKLHVRNTQK